MLLPGRFAAEVERTRRVLASIGLEPTPVPDSEPVDPPEPEPEEDA